MSNRTMQISQPDISANVLPDSMLQDGATHADHPAATIVIPTLNEAAHIARVVSGFLQTGYPNLLEVLVVDGGSTDGTQAIVQELAMHDPRVRLLHNPLTIQSAGLNIGIAEMRGEILLRADGHSAYAPDYIERCIATLIETQALNVGGSPQYIASTPFQAGLAIASKSILGNGGTRRRGATYNGTSDSVSFGCWWKRDLEQLDTPHLRPTPYGSVDVPGRTVRSYFDIDQVVNEDAEINVRFRKINRQAIYISSSIRVWYYPRKTWNGLRKQYFNYGRGRCRSASLHPDLSPSRAKLPLLTGGLIVVFGLIDLLALQGKLRMKQLLLFISAIPFLESLRVTLSLRSYFEAEIWRGHKKRSPSLLQRWLYCSLALWTMIPSYVAGYMYQLIRRSILRIDGW